jgi:hypothetical protein
VRDRLSPIVTALRGIAADPRLADPENHRAVLLSGIDTLLDDLADELAKAARFGLPQTDWSDLTAFRADLFRDVLGATEALVARFGDRLVTFDGLITRYDGLPGSPTDAEHILLLQQAELIVATTPTSPVPPNFKTVVLGRRADFAQARAQFHALRGTAATTLTGLLSAVDALLPLDALDKEGFGLTPFEDRIVAYATTMAARATAVADAVDARLEAAKKALDAHDAAATGPTQVAATPASFPSSASMRRRARSGGTQSPRVKAVHRSPTLARCTMCPSTTGCTGSRASARRSATGRRHCC